jgi:hypothetical protein
MKEKAEIFEIALDEGGEGLAFEIAIEPFGFGFFGTVSQGNEGIEMLRELESHWSQLWPKIREVFRDEQMNHDLGFDLSTDEFTASIQLLEPDEYKADEAKYFLRFHFEDPPLMDFFIHDDQIIHYQRCN